MQVKKWRAQALLAVLLSALFVTAPRAAAFTWPWEGSPWPKSSDNPVAPLDHPSLETTLGRIDWDVRGGFQFTVLGDQRALADGEWQDLMEAMSRARPAFDRLLFMLDTGDIVDDGQHADQFGMLREILGPLREVPYLVGLGNHEVRNNRKPAARANASRFLSSLDPGLSEEAMYYRKDVGPVRFLFLDTNDLVYGDDGGRENHTAPLAGSRAEAQMEWLVGQLAEPEESWGSTVAVLHHPFVQSSEKHRGHALSLWNYMYKGRTLPDILADGGVDLVLAGHTHTYERFLLEREEDGRRMWFLNVSGRPRTSFLWIGDGPRRSRDISGHERKWLTRAGWNLAGWSVTQVENRNDADQFALLTVDGAGRITLEMFFLDGEGPDGLTRGPAELLD